MSWPEGRASLVETARAMARQGFLAGVGGNLALRVDDDHFAVTPSATDYYTMTDDDICILRLRDLRKMAGDKAPSVESGLHARIFLARPDCRASVHTHQPYASAFSLLGRDMDPVPGEFRAQLGSRVPVSGYAPSGTGILARLVARRARPDVSAILMRNHGVVCLGSSMARACETAVALEQAALEWFRRELGYRTQRDGSIGDVIAALEKDTDSRSRFS